MVHLDELADPHFEEYLSTVYMTMLRLGTPTRAALIETGLTEQDVDRATAFLAGRQLITRKGEGVWEVVPPETALPRLAGVLDARARATRRSAGELGALWRQSLAEPDVAGLVGVEMLRSVDQVVLSAHAMAATAEQRIRIFMDDSPASLRLILDEPGPALVAGVPQPAISRVVDVALFAHDGVLGALEAAVRDGQRIVVADGIPFSGMVVDDKVALVDLSRHDARADSSFVVRRGAATAAVAALFEISFELATPMGPTLARKSGQSDQAPLEERDLRVLHLLATGATDQQIARTLAVSTRTVERRVAMLMQALAAGTRFQAGVQATRRGWI